MCLMDEDEPPFVSRRPNHPAREICRMRAEERSFCTTNCNSLLPLLTSSQYLLERIRVYEWSSLNVDQSMCGKYHPSANSHPFIRRTYG